MKKIVEKKRLLEAKVSQNCPRVIILNPGVIILTPA